MIGKEKQKQNMLDHKALISGGIAGVCVDISLFPIDTVKTRLQSPQGFWKSGGFSGIYRGLGSAAAGSFPGAALFFGFYESTKPHFGQAFGEQSPASHMLAASVGELAACLVRVPTENVKQKLQAGLYQDTRGAISGIVSSRGIGGFFVGYGSTIMREIPFSMIQFPLWEGLKVEIGKLRKDGSVRSWESAAAGSLSGAIAAALTTPLDVVKTRLMLNVDANGVPYTDMFSTFRRIWAEEGAAKLFSGVGPRTMWIGIGGFVYFFSYEKSKQILSDYL